MIRGLKKPSESKIKVGDYVFASKDPDGYKNDPWIVNYVSRIEFDRYYFKPTGEIAFKYAKKVSVANAHRILAVRDPEEKTVIKPGHPQYPQALYP